MLKPSLVQMLQVARDMGCKNIKDAYGNYTRYYDCFFYIPEYSKQLKDLTEEIKSNNLTEVRGGLHYLKDMSIDDALKQLNLN